MRSLVLMILFIGLSMIIVGYVKQDRKCPVKIEYRYADRPGEDYLEVGGNLYEDLFKSKDMWMNGLGDHKRQNQILSNA